MAFSVNIASSKLSSIPLDLPLLKLQTPKPSFKLSSPLRNLPSRSSKRISASVPNITSDTQIHQQGSQSLSKWRDFAGIVSGEWDGFGAEFTVEGKPIELPESVVPEAFREWEVKVFDWQTQCPTLAEPEEPVLTYKVIKLLPTVGCEADAATQFSVDEKKIGGVNNEAFSFAYHPTGSFVAIWVLEDREAYRLLDLEHCMVDPRNQESRVRVIQSVQVEKTKMKLQNIMIFCEQWYGPFRNGEQLGGCAIRDSGFASTDALKDTEVLGLWQVTSTVASFQRLQNDIIQELVLDMPRKLVRDQDGLILLPKQLWCSIKEGADGECFAEVGWLLDPGHSLTSACVFVDGTLKEVTIGHETLIPVVT